MLKSDALENKEHIDKVDAYVVVIPKGKQNTPNWERAKTQELKKSKECGKIDHVGCDTLSTREEMSLQLEPTPEDEEMVRADSRANFTSVFLILIVQLLLNAEIERNLIACVLLEPILLQMA